MSNDITIENSENGLSAVNLPGFFDTTSISIVVTDARAEDKPIVYVNRAFELSTGYARSYAIGRNCRFLQGPDTDPEAVRRMREAIEKGRPVTQILTNYRPDGTRFLNELVITPVHDADNTLTYFVGVQNIVTPEKAGEAERLSDRQILEAVQQQVASHLDVIVDISRLPSPDPDVDSSADFLRRINALDVLYRDLGSHASKSDMIDLGAYLSHVASLCSAELARFGVRVNIRTDSVTGPINFAVRLGLILREILENALVHGFQNRDTGFVEVELKVKDRNLHMTVLDDGNGFATADAWPDVGRYGAAVTRRILEQTRSAVTFESAETGTSVEVISPLRPNGAVRVPAPKVKALRSR